MDRLLTSLVVLDTLTATLGGIESYSSVLKNQRPSVALVDSKFSVVDPSFPNSVHDHMFVQGELVGGIPFSFQLRGGPAFKDTPALDWRVYGSKGEIRITSIPGQIWMAGGTHLQVYHFDTEKVEDIDLSKVLDETDPGFGFEAPVDNVARLYNAFAKEDTEKYLDFEKSLHWARFIDNLYEHAGSKPGDFRRKD